MSHKIYVFDIFKSLQGESTFSGLPFVFIRLAGCNLDCKWCDTKNARIQNDRQLKTIDSIVNDIKRLEGLNVCITGGEPLMQKATIDLLDILNTQYAIVTIETNGSLPIKDIPENIHRIVDVKCPSSGMSSKNKFDNLKQLRRKDEVKFVIADRDDYDYAREITRKYLLKCPVERIVTPVEQMMDPEELANWVVSDKLIFRFQFQMHKLLNLK